MIRSIFSYFWFSTPDEEQCTAPSSRDIPKGGYLSVRGSECDTTVLAEQKCKAQPIYRTGRKKCGILSNIIYHREHDRRG